MVVTAIIVILMVATVSAWMRQPHRVCDEHGDVARASLNEVWIEEAGRRAWGLYEAGRI